MLVFELFLILQDCKVLYTCTAIDNFIFDTVTYIGLLGLLSKSSRKINT